MGERDTRASGNPPRRCVMYGAHPAHVGGAGLDVAARAADDRAPSGNDGACTRHKHTAPERYLACDRA